MGWREVASKGYSFIGNNKLSLIILTSVIIGFIIGVILNSTVRQSDRNYMYAGFLGVLYLLMLQGVSLPLSVSCIIKTFATLDNPLIKRFGLQLAAYVILTKLIAVTLAIIMTTIIHPGNQDTTLPSTNETTKQEVRLLIDGFLDMIRNLFPDNLIEMAMSQCYTSITPNGNESLEDADIELARKDGVNMVGMINFSLFFGLALKKMGSANTSLLDLIVTLRRITFEIVKIIMYIAPVLIISMFAEETMKILDVATYSRGLRNYLICVTTTLLIQLFIVYPIMFFLITKRNPLQLFWRYFQAIVTAFATGSSMASVPIAIGTLENYGAYDERLVSFVVPIGFGVNKDGACIFYGCASIFLAQCTDKDLDAGSYILIALLSVITSIVTPGISHGAYNMLYMLLDVLNVQTLHVGNLLSLDYIVDRIVTVVNVTGNGLAVGIISHYNSQIQDDNPQETSEESLKEDDVAHNKDV